MSATIWRNNLSRDGVNRRAGGRRRINAERKAKAQKRREEIKEILGERILFLGTSYGRGLETSLAHTFGVHRSTICRDAAVLLDEFRAAHLCPGCRTLYTIPLKTLTKLARQRVWDGCTSERCARFSSQK